MYLPNSNTPFLCSRRAQLEHASHGTVKKLYELREKYQDTPMIIVAICSESTAISASLAQIQSLLLHRQDLAHVWKSQYTEMPMVLDQALTGCMVVFSCLNAEIQRITAGVADVSRISMAFTSPDGVERVASERLAESDTRVTDCHHDPDPAASMSVPNNCADGNPCKVQAQEHSSRDQGYATAEAGCCPGIGRIDTIITIEKPKRRCRKLGICRP
jgi:hypothetical protein